MQQAKIVPDKERTIKEQMTILKQVETDIGSMDKYVEYCTRKYKPFVFELQQYMEDLFIEQAIFVQDKLITNGQHKGSHYWGQCLG